MILVQPRTDVIIIIWIKSGTIEGHALGKVLLKIHFQNIMYVICNRASRFQVYRNGQIFCIFGQPPMPLKHIQFTGELYIFNPIVEVKFRTHVKYLISYILSMSSCIFA